MDIRIKEGLLVELMSNYKKFKSDFFKIEKEKIERERILFDDKKYLNFLNSKLYEINDQHGSVLNEVIDLTLALDSSMRSLMDKQLKRLDTSDANKIDKFLEVMDSIISYSYRVKEGLKDPLNYADNFEQNIDSIKEKFSDLIESSSFEISNDVISEVQTVLDDFFSGYKQFLKSKDKGESIVSRTIYFCDIALNELVLINNNVINTFSSELYYKYYMSHVEEMASKGAIIEYKNYLTEQKEDTEKRISEYKVNPSIKNLSINREHYSKLTKLYTLMIKYNFIHEDTELPVFFGVFVADTFIRPVRFGKDVTNREIKKFKNHIFDFSESSSINVTFAKCFTDYDGIALNKKSISSTGQEDNIPEKFKEFFKAFFTLLPIK
jgi:flagellin-specific chaperone FliS